MHVTTHSSSTGLQNFDYHPRTRVIFGENSLERVGELTRHDKAALRTQLLRWADIESLKRVLVSHGASIEDRPREVLRELAGSLA